MQPTQGSTQRDNQAARKSQNNPYIGLIESLAGDVIISYARGRRVLDAGARSPRIAAWIQGVSPYPVERWPGPDEPFPDSPDALKFDAPDHCFDLVYSMWTFSQIGHDQESSRQMARAFLEECQRVVRPGGYLLLHARNAVSLRGAWAKAGRQIISHLRISDRPMYERWDSLSQFVRLLPPTLSLVDGHGLGVLTLNAQLLRLPVLGRIGRSIAWSLRDSKSLRHLAGDMLCVVRRVPAPPSLPPQ